MKHFPVMILLFLCLTGCAVSGGTVSCYAEQPEVQTSIDTTTETPAPIAADLSDPAILMAECEEPFSLTFPRSPTPDGITVHIHNDSGRDAQILLIPALERKAEDGSWESVPFRAKIGFCGTPDPLPCEGKEWSVDTQLLYGTLPPGTYRLSYTVTDADGTEHTASGTFQLGDRLCGYPAADYFG